MEELGALGKVSETAITNNRAKIKRILEDEEKYSISDTFSFDEVVKRYNPGITEEELKAWVWYQRGHGEKMKGWDKYYLKLDSDAVTTVFVKSQGELVDRKAMLKDNHFRDLVELDYNVKVGNFTGKRLEYDKEYYLIVKTSENAQAPVPSNSLVYIREKEVEQVRYETKIDAPILHEYVKKGILFYTDGQLLPYAIYAYANMYDRELQLNKDKNQIISAYGQETFDRQYKMIMETMRPKLLSVINPDITQRPKILSISKFAKDFNIDYLREEIAVEMEDPTSLFEAFKLWIGKLDIGEFKRVKPKDLIKYYLDGDNLSKMLTDDEKTTIEKYGMLEAEELFSRFLHIAITFEDQQKIDFTWNRTFNGHSSIPYHKVPVGFACSAMFKSGVLRFSQTQREAIAFMEIAKSGIIAYDVGVGKTMAAIITLANNLYSTKCQRPLIVVPNPTYAKWLREIIGYTDPKTKEFVPGVLSNLDYKVNEWYNLGKDYKSKINFNKQVPTKSITVVTYEGFAKLGFSSESFEPFFDELAGILNQEDVSKLTQRDREKRNQGYREMLGMGNKNTIADFDKLGFDYIVIDEAHNFKNVFNDVLAEGGIKRFKVNGNQSTRAIKAFFICNYVQRVYGRNVMLLTATPFTNSPLEIYSMLSLVAYNYMKRNGLYNVQRFMEAFILQTLEYVNSYDDTMKEQHVVKSFNNRLVLQQLIFNHIAYKTGEDAGVKRPCKINLPRLYAKDASGAFLKLEKSEQILTYLEMSPLQREYQDEIVNMARNATRGDNDLMQALGHSLNNAISPFLYKNSMLPMDYLEFIEESPKLKYVMDCIKSVKKWHEDRNEDVSGQVIYINRGKEFFKFIKEYLEKEIGYKSNVKYNRDTLDEVEILTSGMTLEKKETIKEAFLEGIVKVIIGTSTIREGIDLQRKGTVLYNCYPDWNVTDVKQLEGRIWRQGNQFGYVRVVMPLVQDSMDVFVFQKLEEKTSRLNDIWFRGGSVNVIDVESLDPEEVKFALFTNINAIVEIMHKKQLAEVSRQRSVAETNMELLMGMDGTLRKYFEYKKQVIAKLKDLADNFQYQFLDNDSLEDYIWFGDLKPEERIEVMERMKNLVDETNTLIYSPIQDDRAILKLGRQWTKLIKEMDYYERSMDVFGKFTSLVSEVRKAEEGILKTKGYSINDNLLDVIQAYRTERDKLNLEYQSLQTYEHREKLYNEIKEKKDKLLVGGASPEERAAEFAKLNYLLSYEASDISGDNCILPGIELQRVRSRPSEDRDRKLKLIRVRAMAFKLKRDKEKLKDKNRK